MNDYLRLYEQGEIAFYNLSIPALGVLNVVTKQARENKDKINVTLTYPVALNYGYDKTNATFSRGLKELKDKDVVIEVQHPLYWYNPELFYNGQNRINHVTSYVLKK